MTRVTPRVITAPNPLQLLPKCTDRCPGAGSRSLSFPRADRERRNDGGARGVDQPHETFSGRRESAGDGHREGNSSSCVSPALSGTCPDPRCYTSSSSLSNKDAADLNCT
ncbi:hypothetical protein XELAEV_18018144mg [Xenopus laevis]|uniref:Uncharacterized protein n=1 Tax=Xenopus laevis TaxID=8355 RepID=A0A974HT50_XENLA|nr:hypothetical protein XELAEV_18018144mg [Xenopus laevis]